MPEERLSLESGSRQCLPVRVAPSTFRAYGPYLGTYEPYFGRLERLDREADDFFAFVGIIVVHALLEEDAAGPKRDNLGSMS
jgi:hypothetical protein